jgi:methyl-accepting chemotaxis protein
MVRRSTFGQKMGAGFAVNVVLTVAVAIVAICTLRAVVASKDRVVSVNAQNLIDAARLQMLIERKMASDRGFFLTGEARFLEEIRSANSDFAAVLSGLKARVYTEKGREMVEKIDELATEHKAITNRAIAARSAANGLEAAKRIFDQELLPKTDAFDQLINNFTSWEQQLLDQEKEASTETASSAITLLVIIGVVALFFAAGAALFLTRLLIRQIGSAVLHVRSSSTELQAAASQQATGAKEQSAATSEITTTTSELLATSRQIAESAQHVAQIAEETLNAAHDGDQTVQKTQESIMAIKRQVDLIVARMLELGKKSQQVGSILEIIDELAEQTNILAINATIEAVGAGEVGKRFAVVAEEIRKLADRVGESSKEIRGLIEEVRTAVNTTVMATESGSKAVDAGSQQFGDVTTSFTRIVGLVGTATDAAREIELSTKQQATAVEQVNVALANVAQAARETEVSSGQALQTASELTEMSRGLALLVQANGRA